MKTSPSVYTLALVNACPFILDILCYSYGEMPDLYLFLPIILALTALNYSACKRILPYVLIQGFMLLCEVTAGSVSTLLYYHNVSSDVLSPAIGLGMTLIGSAIILVITTVTSIIKHIRLKKSF